MTRKATEDRPGAARWVPDRLAPGTVADGIRACRGCELYRDATQAVPGEGPTDARLMVVGEQPGDQEDRAGHPFVGPAGRLLDRALADAGLAREEVFATNVVKHFRWERGRHSNRLHKGPGRTHVAACGPWMVAEIDLVRPEGIVLLGATAGQAVYGPGFRVSSQRGQRLDWPDEDSGPSLVLEPGSRPDWLLATVHPSSVLRSRNRDADYAALVADLSVVPELTRGS